MTNPVSKTYLAQVSIVLPAKNEVDAVGQTVTKIRQQFPEIQILVVDCLLYTSDAADE